MTIVVMQCKFNDIEKQEGKREREGKIWCVRYNRSVTRLATAASKRGYKYEESQQLQGFKPITQPS